MASGNSTVTYRNIEGFPGYRVGDDGSVWSCRPINGKGPLSTVWRQLKTQRNTYGYRHVLLHRPPLPKVMACVHILVLEAFVGPRPDGFEACHFPDGDRANNRLENLRWDSRKENRHDAIKHGTIARGSRNGSAKLSDDQVRAIRAERAAGSSCRELGLKYGVDRTTVHGIVTRRLWYHI